MHIPDSKLAYLFVEELQQLADEVRNDLDGAVNEGFSQAQVASLQLDLDLVLYHLGEAQSEGRYAPVAEEPQVPPNPFADI